MDRFCFETRAMILRDGVCGDLNLVFLLLFFSDVHEHLLTLADRWSGILGQSENFTKKPHDTSKKRRFSVYLSNLFNRRHLFEKTQNTGKRNENSKLLVGVFGSQCCMFLQIRVIMEAQARW